MADNEGSAHAKAPEVKVPVEAEPQNELTKKFTEKDWDAVKELRTALPLIIEEAVPTDPEGRFRVTDMWGVPLDPSRVDDARVSVILLKFIKAVNYDVEEATKRLIATIKWREEFKASETVNEEFPTEVFGTLGHVFGHDKEGRPITWNVYGGIDQQAVFGDLNRFLRWRVGLMERGLREVNFTTVDSMIQVHDYLGASRDANSKKAATAASKLFTDYYPELLHQKYFVNVPTLLTYVFWIFKPLLPAATFAKLKVVGVGPEVIGKELSQRIPIAELPKQYGGTAEGF
ncbi:CRAL/TRIO domain-containing protein [Cantharellus anzutake]|uniref:CRAL/TRIO domain-containing protein n=1 Tax=Cantharellus anzutake TaxID=1750568 RepID=UPI001906180C|nr:CRAL/TRIO domain-containing protein [Cantharellus anzutake]KAF8329477.1 CRAL/TRIO domain-containing protein [Cantharellus anzutake]